MNDCCEEEVVEYEIEDAIVKSGSFGLLQIFVTIITMLIVFSVACQSLMLYYVADDPPWTCVAKNSSEFCLKHYGEVITQSSDFFSKRCKMKRDQWKFTKDNSFSIVSEFDLVCDESYIAALTNAGFFIGWGVGGLFMGYLADVYGRKIILFLALLTISIAALASTYITAIYQLICLRIIIGAGFGSATNASYTMISEVVGSKYRLLVGSFFHCPFDWSNLALTLLAYYIQHWRKIVFYTALPLFPIAIMSFMLPETVRWLYATGKTEKAEQLIIKIAKINKKKLEKFKLEPILQQEEKKTYNYTDLLFRKLKVTLLVMSVCFQWMANGLIYYGYTLESSDLGGDIYFNFALSSLVCLPTPITFNLCCQKFGRKKSYIGFTILICLTLIMLSVLSALPESIKHIDLMKIVIAMMGKAFVSNSFGILYIWSFELYPTVVRSQGQTLGQVAGRIGAVAAPFIATSLSSIYRPLPFVLMATIAVVALFLSLTLPETGKKKTRENFDDFFDTPTEVLVGENINNEDVDDRVNLLNSDIFE